MDFRSIFFEDEAGGKPRLFFRLFNGTLALLLLSGLFTFSFHQLAYYHWNWSAIGRYRAMFFRGWCVTVAISLVSLVASTVIGLLFAFASRSRVLLLRYFARIYVELVWGTPLLVQILVFFYVVADAFHVHNRYVVGVLVLSVFSAAYISEIVRAGIESVGKSQIEAARAVGFTRAQTYRYVIFPQAIRQMLPALAGQFALLVKNSSLLSIIAINELTLNAEEVNSYTYRALESYIPLALGYLVLTIPISVWTRWLESRNRYES